MASAAIRPSVRVAVRAEGALNAGTPSDTASTPVIAVQPLANADNSTNSGERAGAERRQRVDGLERHRPTPPAPGTPPAAINENMTPTNA